MQDAELITRTSLNSAAPRLRAATRSAGRQPFSRCAAAGLVCCAWACCANADDKAIADGTVVRMYASAVVTGDHITLADVAELTGDAARLAGTWQLGPAPKPGDTVALTLDRMQEILARQGANLAQWVFRGNTSCQITRPTEAASRADAPDTSRTAGLLPSSRPADTGGQTDPHETAVLDANSLGGILQAHIRQRLSSLGGTPLVSFPVHLQSALALSRPTYDFSVVDTGDQLLGLVSFEVTVTGREGERQVMPLVAKVSLRRQMVIAAKNINRGQTIEESDLRIEERVFERTRDIGVSDMEPLVGQQARRFIMAGTQIELRDIEPVPLVKRNDLVTVIVRRDGLLITASARAQTSGGYGDTVELKSEMAKRSVETFTAVVTGRKRVEIGAQVAAPFVAAPQALANEGGD